MHVTIIDPPRRNNADADTRLLRQWGACPDHVVLTPAELRGCRMIVQMVAQHFHLSDRDIFLRRRTARIALPRQISMHLMRVVLHLPLLTIGRLYDRDHGTVIHAGKAVSSHCLSTPAVAAAWESLHAAALDISAS